MMKKDKLWTILTSIALAFQVLAEVLTCVIVMRLNMLPAKYNAVLIVAFALLIAATAFLLFMRRKKPVGDIRRIVACMLALLVVCGCAVVSKVATDAYQTMHAMTIPGEVTSIKNIYVFVRNDDPAVQLSDTADYTYAVVQDYDVEYTEKVIEIIEAQTGKALTITQYEKTTDLADALFAKEADALILNGAAVTLMMEEEAYGDFTEKARILYTVTPADLGESEDPIITPGIEGDISTKPFVVYISGSDTRSSILNVSRSDVNILVVVNPVSKQVLLLNTPRDYYVPNPAGKGKLDKLTHCGLYGTECSMEALSNLYDVEINYYAQINFTGFETLIDAVGGITVYSDQAFSAHHTKIQKGMNTLNGAQALDFARERYHVSGGDNGRGKNQMKVIEALIKKLTSGTTIISNYSGILKSMEGMFKTSITMDDVSELVKMQLNDMASWNIQSFAVTGKGGSEKTYSMPGVYAYVMHPNEDVVEQAKNLVDKVIAGENLTDEDVKIPK